MVPGDTEAESLLRRKNTACFVHSLLESQRGNGQRSRELEGIAEQLRTSTVESGQDSKKNAENDMDQPVEAKGKTVHYAQCDSEKKKGQPDEEAWRQRLARTQDGQHPSPPSEHSGGETHSRLLTKKQLSDMAWGVRELSKRLGSIRLKLKVKSVFLLTKAHDETLIGNTREVARWLLSEDRHVRYTVYVEENLKDNKKFDAQGLLDELEAQRQSRTGNISQEEGGSGSATPTATNRKERRLRYWNNDMCRQKPHNFDFVVTLGGDGTVLYASWLFQRIVPPVLSFALGSLGFLTKFDYDDFEQTLTNSFRDGITVSLRLRFEGTVMRSQKRQKVKDGAAQGANDLHGKVSEEESSRDLVEELVGEEKEDEETHRPDGTYQILNDIVVDRGPNPSESCTESYISMLTFPAMSSTEIFGDDEHFTSVQADGVCVATPTGSTAYNLAAGGSLCHPENPVILVTAICAHTLSFRPIILPDTIVLRVGVPYDARTSSWASFDGRERVELCPGDYVTISASRYPFANVMPQGRRSEDWVNSISGKLGWNTRQRQKSYKEWS